MSIPELFIDGEIGPDWMGGISGASVEKELKKIGKAKEIVVRINSPGGDCFEAFAIYNALRRHGAKISVKVDSLAASAASLIAMAGDTIEMAENSMMMVHNCWCMVAGNKADLAKTIEILDRVDQNLRATYVARTGISEREIAELLDAETWMTAGEALAFGFADSIGQPLLGTEPQIASGRYKNTPKHLLSQNGRDFRSRELERIKTLNDAARERNRPKTPLLDAARRKHNGRVAARI